MHTNEYIVAAFWKYDCQFYTHFWMVGLFVSQTR